MTRCQAEFETWARIEGINLRERAGKYAAKSTRDYWSGWCAEWVRKEHEAKARDSRPLSPIEIMIDKATGFQS